MEAWYRLREGVTKERFCEPSKRRYHRLTRIRCNTNTVTPNSRQVLFEDFLYSLDWRLDRVCFVRVPGTRRPVRLSHSGSCHRSPQNEPPPSLARAHPFPPIVMSASIPAPFTGLPSQLAVNSISCERGGFRATVAKAPGWFFPSDLSPTGAIQINIPRCPLGPPTGHIRICLL
jgi:hypothetical protein